MKYLMKIDDEFNEHKYLMKKTYTRGENYTPYYIQNEKSQCSL